MGISAALADHVAAAGPADVPPEVLAAAARSLLDAVGVSLGAAGLVPECLPFVELARQEAGAADCTILGFDARASTTGAAFANGALAHALDFEDSHDLALCHPHAQVVPVALALAEARRPVSGARLLTAIAVGADITCRLSLALSDILRERGWYPPSLLGGFGATATAASLLGFDRRRTLDAFTLVLGQLGSHGRIHHGAGSSLRSVRDAFPAQAAILSALLAERGVRGDDEPLEGRGGFFDAYAGEAVEPRAILDELGERYEGAAVSFKPWPSCRATHAFVEAALRIDAGSIVSVRLAGSPRVSDIVAEPRQAKLRPRTVIEAKFSAPFVSALALTDGEVGLHSFDENRLTDPALLDLAQRITFVADPRFGPEGGSLSVTTADGREATEVVAAAYGSPSAPIAAPDLLAKFLDCASHAPCARTEQEWRALADAILAVGEADDAAASLALGQPRS